MQKGGSAVDLIIDDEANASVVSESELISSGLKRPRVEMRNSVNYTS